MKVELILTLDVSEVNGKRLNREKVEGICVDSLTECFNHMAITPVQDNFNKDVDVCINVVKVEVGTK